MFDRSSNPLSFGSLLSQNSQLVLAVTRGPSTCNNPYLNVNQNQNTSDWKCSQFSQNCEWQSWNHSFQLSEFRNCCKRKYGREINILISFFKKLPLFHLSSSSVLNKGLLHSTNRYWWFDLTFKTVGMWCTFTSKSTSSVSFVGAMNVVTKVSSEKGSSDSLDNALLGFQWWSFSSTCLSRVKGTRSPVLCSTERSAVCRLNSIPYCSAGMLMLPGKPSVSQKHLVGLCWYSEGNVKSQVLK